MNPPRDPGARPEYLAPSSAAAEARLTLAQAGELETIRRLIEARGTDADAAGKAGVRLDAGDDAAVWRATAGLDVVATTDTFVERRHWDPRFGDSAEHGARLAAANLSDLAAMAAMPRVALLSIGARPDDPLAEWIAFERGLAQALAGAGAVIAGGNLTATDGARWASVTLLGEAEPARIWTRAGGKPGDALAVTGWPGRAGAGQRIAARWGDGARVPEWEPLLDAWLRPRPRNALALALAASGGVTAAIDVSDGLAGDLGRLAEASGAGAELDDAAFPSDAALEKAAAALGCPLAELRYGASDDYELLLALDPARVEPVRAIARELGVPLAVIGRLTEGRGAIVRRGPVGESVPLEPVGYDHFPRG